MAVEASQTQTETPKGAAVVAPPADKKPDVVAADGKTPDPKPSAEEKRIAGSAFAVIAKKERAMVEGQRALKAERAKFAEEQAKHVETLKEAERIRELKANAKSNPVAYLSEVFGPNWYEVATNIKLNGGKVTPELIHAAVKDEISGLKKELAADSAKSAADEKARAQAEYNDMLERFRDDAMAHTKKHADKFELINLYDEHGLVPALIEENYRKTKRLMTTDEAAELVEKHLEEQVQKAQASKKFQSKAPSPAQGDSKRIDSAQPRTLTNDMTASTPSVSSPAKTEAERMARALAALG
jgi:hypothetical protein